MTGAPESPTVDAHGVAAMLSISKDDFLRRRPRLTRVHGFPRVLPGLGRVWSRAAVLAWIAEFSGMPAEEAIAVRDMPEDAGAPALPHRRLDTLGQVIDDAREKLERKYGAAA